MVKNKVWPRQNVLGKPHLQKSKTRYGRARTFWENRISKNQKQGMAETERSGKTASPKIKNKVWPRQNVLGKPHLQKSKTIKNTAGVHPATYIVNQT